MKWTVENIKRKVDGDVVSTVVYRVVAKSGSLIADHKGKVDLPHKNPTTKTFVPFEKLTEEQVITWVKSKVDVSGIEASVQAALDAKVAKVSEATLKSGLPWKKQFSAIRP